jgi:hypothetical protein
MYTMECYSAIKEKEILSFADKWMELKNILLREVSQVQNAQSLMFSVIYRIQT